MDIFTLLQKRRSIREFRQDPVHLNKIETILAAGHHSPSGGNRHPWHYIVVSEPEKKKYIREECEKADEEWHRNADDRLKKWLKAKHITAVKHFLTDAPYLIVVFGDKRDPYWKESTWISIGYMMLAAVDQGLGTVIYTPGNGSFLNEFLSVPGHFEPQVILPVGIPLVDPQTNSKKQTEMEYNYRLRMEADSTGADGNKIKSAGDTDDEKDIKTDNGRKCACGCGRPLIGLNPKRKYIHGHSKFGENGIFTALKSPPKCRCGCEKETEWDWDRMTWKKYIDSHIGIRKKYSGPRIKPKKQIDLFD